MLLLAALVRSKLSKLKTREDVINDNGDNLRPNQIAPHSPTRLIGDPAYPWGAQWK